jgi:GDP/UDP-N,N'-diacetylbacillosamine 2-epimerase (hydrolysing)
MERVKFINLMRYARFLIGNSSAGIMEAPIIPLGVINVGIRQKGRYAADNVVFTGESHNQIKKGVETVLSDEFKDMLKNIKSPYGDGKSVDKAYNLITSLDLESNKYKTEDPLYNE